MKKIAGYYMDVPFTGKVTYEEVVGTTRGTAYYVDLDKPIEVFGSVRKSICVFANDHIAVTNQEKTMFDDFDTQNRIFSLFHILAIELLFRQKFLIVSVKITGMTLADS